VEDLAAALRAGADAALAASIFHYGQVRIADAKARLAASGIGVRAPLSAS
jgi:cyclase